MLVSKVYDGTEPISVRRENRFAMALVSSAYWKQKEVARQLVKIHPVDLSTGISYAADILGDRHDHVRIHVLSFLRNVVRNKLHYLIIRWLRHRCRPLMRAIASDVARTLCKDIRDPILHEAIDLYEQEEVKVPRSQIHLKSTRETLFPNVNEDHGYLIVCLGHCDVDLGFVGGTQTRRIRIRL